MDAFPKISQMGERSILIQFEPEISENVLKKVLTAQKILQKKLLKENVEVMNTYNSLLISYPVGIDNPYDAFSRLKEELRQAKIQHSLESRLFYIPVCYDEQFALDLAEMSAAKNLSKEEIIRLHSSAFYTVYFTGFLPGFLYLGGLPEGLYFSRRSQPRLEVQKGAVGIGEKQTGIYPQKSPGGWNIIGNSPVRLFDPEANPPCEIKAGDKIQCYEVDVEKHQEILEGVKRGTYKLRKEVYGG